MNSFSFLKVAILSILVLSFFISGTAFAGEKYKGFERGDALITVKALKKMIDDKDPSLVIIGVAKGASFKAGHIPGALNVWRPDYEPAVDNPYPFGGMILNRTDFEKFARGLGVNNDSKVVIYDEKYDATRLWWAFFLYGKKDCMVLDGGYQAWKAAGFETGMAITAPEAAKEGNFEAKAPLYGWIAGMDDIWLAKTDPEIHVWDTREGDEWNGEKLKKGAFRKGRVPWATFQNWKEFKMKVNEDEKNPTAFKPAAEIQKVIDKYGMDKNHRHVFYCQSGVRTTTNMFVLYLMGWSPSKLANYDGSWIEWSYFDKNPVVVGE